MTQFLVTRIPFGGFYDSLWSGMLDSEEEQFCDYEAEYRQTEEGIPSELQLDRDAIFDAIDDSRDYKAQCLALAKTYVSQFDNWAGGEANESRSRYGWTYTQAKGSHKARFRVPSLGLQFESMDSPREYNFTTDRVYAKISLATCRRLFKKSKQENHETLKARIRASYTSCDGFSSHYSNQLCDWLEKPLIDWDHNELCTLIEAACNWTRDCEMEIYQDIPDSGHSEWSEGIDWPKYQSLIDAKREEKAEILRAEGKEIPHFRCDKTPELAL